MVLMKNKNTGFAMLLALVTLATFSFIAYLGLENSEDFNKIISSKSHQRLQKQQVFSLVQRYQAELHHKVEEAIQDSSSMPNPQQVLNLDSSFQLSASCLGEGDPIVLDGICSNDPSKFPKVYTLRLKKFDAERSSIIQAFAQIELTPARLKDFALVVTDESASSLNIGNSSFDGKVSLRFRDGEVGRLRFFNSEEIFFKESLYTNLQEPSQQIEFEAGSSPDLVSFEKGIIKSPIQSSDLIENFSTLRQDHKGPLIDDTVFRPARPDETTLEFSESGGRCRLKVVAHKYPSLSEGEGLEVGFTESEVIFDGQVEPGTLIYSASERVRLLPSSSSDPNKIKLCDGIGNFTLLAENDVRLATSIVRDAHYQDEGHIAIVSLSSNITLDERTRSLAGDSFADLASGVAAPVPGEDSFIIDANLVSVGSGEGLHPPLEVSSSVLSVDHARLGRLSLNGALIGPSTSYFKRIDPDTGEVISGFEEVVLSFSEEKLASPPPGFLRATATSLSSSIVSFGFHQEDVEKAIRELEKI